MTRSPASAPGPISPAARARHSISEEIIMVKVRLARAGSKKRPFYHLVVTDHQKARDGRFIEEVGHYDPARPIAEAKVDHVRLAYWTGVGAQLSETVAKVVRDHAKAHASA